MDIGKVIVEFCIFGKPPVRQDNSSGAQNRLNNEEAVQSFIDIFVQI
jgi:hypothetical protein